MLTYRLHLIRHGLTKANLEGRYIGVTDPPLCEEGLEHLLDQMETARYPQVQKVYTSPLQRCVGTAETLYPDAFTEQVPQLREYDFGEFENQSIAQLKTDERFLQWMESGSAAAPPQGEEPEDFAKRLEEGLDYILHDMMENRITDTALITHGGVIMNLLARFGYPKQTPNDWLTTDGGGFTVLVTPQLWMRDRLVEVYGRLPLSSDAQEEPVADGEEEDDYDWRQDV